MNRLRIMAAGLIAALFSVSAIAQNDIRDEADGIINRTPDPVNDYALGWLQQIFGDFIFLPWGGSTSDTGVDATIVAHAVGFTNVVALILGIVIAGYVVLAGIIRTAHEGEVLGKGWSTVWWPFRTAVAFGLITPAIGIGGGVVSLAQAFVLSLIIIGSNAGSFLWEKAGDWITGGTPLVAQESSLGMGPSKSMLKALVCAQSVYLYEQNMSTGRNQVASIIRSDYPFPDVIPGPLESANFTIPDTATRIVFGNEHNSCGSISFTEVSKDEGSFNRGYQVRAMLQGHQAARREIGSHLNKLKDIAHLIVVGDSQNGLGGGETLEKLIQSENSSQLMARARVVSEEYATIATNFSRRFPAEVAKATTGDPSIAEAWKKEVTQGGWGAAGLWFFEISRFQMLSEGVTSKVIGSIAEASSPSFCGFLSMNLLKRWRGCADYEERAMKDMTSGVDIIHSAAAGITGHLTRQEKAQARLDQVKAEDLDSGIFDGLSVVIGQKILGHAASFEDEEVHGMAGFSGVSPSSNGLVSPFRTVTGIGHALNWGAGAAWSFGLAASTSTGFFKAMGNNTPLAGGPLGAVAGATWWIMSTLTALGMALIPLGFVMAFLIPFMPIITWTRLLAAYLLTSIEAVVATPLAVIMMVTPEGEGISGTRLERAIQLLASIIFRPTLLVIGLIAALLLAFVSFGILNFFFWRVAEMVTDSGLFELIAILVIYTTAAFQVAKASVMVIHKLPDQILDWMAGGVGGRSFGDDAEASIESGLGQAKGGLSSAAGSLGSRLSERKASLAKSGGDKDRDE